jgi:hypothetical protein
MGRRADPRTLVDGLPGADGVDRFVPLTDELAAKTKRQVERGKAEDRHGKHDVVPNEEPGDEGHRRPPPRSKYLDFILISIFEGGFYSRREA